MQKIPPKEAALVKLLPILKFMQPVIGKKQAYASGQVSLTQLHISLYLIMLLPILQRFPAPPGSG